MRPFAAVPLLVALVLPACTPVVRYTDALVSDPERTWFTKLPATVGGTVGFVVGVPVDVAALVPLWFVYRSQARETRDPLSVFLFPSFVLWKAGVLLATSAWTANAQPVLSVSATSVAPGATVTVTVTGTPGRYVALLGSSTKAGFSHAGVPLSLGPDGGLWYCRQYGNPDDADDWAAMQRWSPYHNVPDAARTRLPPVLFATSTRDDRVHPAQPLRVLRGERVPDDIPGAAGKGRPDDQLGRAVRFRRLATRGDDYAQAQKRPQSQHFDTVPPFGAGVQAGSGAAEMPPKRGRRRARRPAPRQPVSR